MHYLNNTIYLSFVTLHCLVRQSLMSNFAQKFIKIPEKLDKYCLESHCKISVTYFYILGYSMYLITPASLKIFEHLFNQPILPCQDNHQTQLKYFLLALKYFLMFEEFFFQNFGYQTVFQENLLSFSLSLGFYPLCTYLSIRYKAFLIQ